jgi:hypothetical protein
MFRPLVGAALAALALAPAASAATTAPSFDYAIIGDTPYGASMLSAFPSQIAGINADPDASLVMHLGDIKNGSSRCDTTYFEQIRDAFNTFADPLVYTPGDNEWTDCHRANNGGYQPARKRVAGAPVATDAKRTRLEELRRLFFPVAGQTLGATPRTVTSMAGGGPKENVRWIESDVAFATAHVVGSNNGDLPWFGASETHALQEQRQLEFQYRNRANVRWLDVVFGEAIANNRKAVAIGIQADMWDPFIVNDRKQYSGYTQFVRKLAYWARTFKKPVLLLNGDSHVFTEDAPLADAASWNTRMYGVPYAVPNLKRVTVDGSSNANNWLKLHVDPSSAGVFSWARVSHPSGV